MKKYFISFAILFIIVLGFGIYTMTSTSNDSSSPISWPDFVKLNDTYYVKENTEIPSSDIDTKIGEVKTNSPKESCKWSPENYEAGNLEIGTELYTIKDETLTGIAAWVDDCYIYYKEVTEDDFFERTE